MFESSHFRILCKYIYINIYIFTLYYIKNYIKFKEYSLIGKIGSFKLQFLSSNLSALGFKSHI